MASAPASSHMIQYAPIDRMQVAFESESAADAVLALMKRGTIRHPRSGGRWDTLNSYECGFCKKWHHGHP